MPGGWGTPKQKPKPDPKTTRILDEFAACGFPQPGLAPRT